MKIKASYRFNSENKNLSKSNLEETERFGDIFLRNMGLIEDKCRDGWRVQEIAFILKKDPSDFTRTFRQYKGITPKKYIDEKRREKLIEYIADSNQYGYTVGKALGFANEKSFYRWTKRTFGKTFREMQMQYISKPSKYSHLESPEILPRNVTQK